MREFKLKILTPDGEIFSGDAYSLKVRCDGGDVEIMAGHQDLFASLGTGEARLTTALGTRFASTQGGFISVKGGECKMVATTFEFSEDIDLNRARRAKEKAEEKLRTAQDERAYKLAKMKLLRAQSRINVKMKG